MKANCYNCVYWVNEHCLRDENKMFPKKDWEVCTDGQWSDDPLDLEKLRQIHLSTHELALQFIKKEKEYKSQKSVKQ